MEDPRIPSIPDPFDLKDCAQLPFPLTAAEDHILKHILRICGSDQQMAKRAYDSIVCMWAKKDQTSGLQATLLGLNPSVVNTVDPVIVTLTGADFHPSCKVYKNGFNNGNMNFISPTEIRTTISFEEAFGVTINVVNPGNIISNGMTLTFNPHPDTPRIGALQPVTMSKEIVGIQTLHVHGANFLTGCVITKSANNPGLWDGVEVPTTRVSSTELTTSYDLTNAPVGVAVIRVKNKTANGHYLSYPVFFNVTAI
jgi:hypothetical protein